MEIAGYEVTNEELRALAYLVPDPAAWIEHCAKERKAEEKIKGKIKKALILIASVPEEEYTTRAERDEAELAALLPTEEQAALERELALARLSADLEAAMKSKLSLAQAYLERQIKELSE